MVRLVVHVHCDAPNCEAMTTATAYAQSALAPFGGDLVYRNIRFPRGPRGEESGWRVDGDGRCWCAGHGASSGNPAGS